MGWESFLHDIQHRQFLNAAAQQLAVVSPAQWCQTFYLLAAACVLAVASTPAEAKTLLVDYGARKSTLNSASSSSSSQQPSRSDQVQRELQQKQTSQNDSVVATTTKQFAIAKGKGTGDKPDKKENAKDGGIFLPLIAHFTSHWTQVPHSWFAAFYIVSVACSLFWAVQYLTDGSILRFIASNQALSLSGADEAGVTFEQLAAAWTMMLLQGGRRIYEHAAVMRPSSKSTMWFVHWLLGLSFYILTNVAIWVEGSSKQQIHKDYLL